MATITGFVRVPNLVADALEHDGVYDFGLGVVLRAPTDPDGSGASASYRVEYRVEPVVPGRPMAKREAKYARDLVKAYAVAEAKFDEMKRRVAGTYVEYATDTPFGEVVDRWFDSPHPRWSERYPTKVQGLLRGWVTADHVTVVRGAGHSPEPIARVPIGALTADHYNQALEHVRSQRAYRTYTDVHGLVVQILKWAAANRYLRASERELIAHMPLAVHNDNGDGSIGDTRPVLDDEIPPTETIDALADTAQRLFDRRVQTMIYLLAYTGLRISECLALRADDRFVYDHDDACWRIHVREQVHKSTRKTTPPKWRRQRWAFVPDFLTDEVAWLLADTDHGQLLFPSPGRRVKTATGQVVRVRVGLFPYDNWRDRVFDRVAEATPGWPERDDWWPKGLSGAPADSQGQRRWKWAVHSLRHVAATYQLNVLKLDPDDVARFLGHRSGIQVWELYVRVRPHLYRRASEASRAAGDPRTRIASSEQMHLARKQNQK